MNSLERILKTLSYQEADRVPVLPVLLLQGAKLLNLELPQYFSKAEYMARGQMALIDKYDHDAVYGIPHVIEDIEAFGGQLHYVPNGSPTCAKMPWRDWNDAGTARVPDPHKHPALVRTLQTLELLAQKFKGQKLIVGGAIAPFSLPSMLAGSEKWFELIWEDELIQRPVMQRVLNITRDFCITWANAQLQAGADVIVLADGMASATCIMREQFEKLALPVIQETIAAIEGTVVYEPVGRIEPFADLMPRIGAGLVILDCHDDIRNVKNILQGKMGVMGNLNNIQMIRWSREEMFNNCISLLNQVGAGGGMLLSSQGPEIPWDVPDEVIQAMIDAAKTWRQPN